MEVAMGNPWRIWLIDEEGFFSRPTAQELRQFLEEFLEPMVHLPLLTLWREGLACGFASFGRWVAVGREFDIECRSF
jgi:hypothetical protein